MRRRFLVPLNILVVIICLIQGKALTEDKAAAGGKAKLKAHPECSVQVRNYRVCMTLLNGIHKLKDRETWEKTDQKCESLLKAWDECEKAKVPFDLKGGAAPDAQTQLVYKLVWGKRAVDGMNKYRAEQRLDLSQWMRQLGKIRKDFEAAGKGDRFEDAMKSQFEGYRGGGGLNLKP